MANSEIYTTPEYLRAEKTALRLIARAEQCRAGLSRKLEKRGFDTAAISAVISRLCELNLLDDNRFARLWLQSRLRFTRGPRRLLSSLRARGLNQNDAQAALNEALDEETEFALITRFVKNTRKKAVKNGAAHLKNFLKSEGFSIQIIKRFLEEE